MKSNIIVGKVSTAQAQILDQIQVGFSTDSLDQHPDIFSLKPKPSIGITKIRKLIHFLNQKPFRAQKKLAIIYQADLMTLPAQNAFLKTLEEPPANSLIYLITNQPSKLLPTIISRCRLINLKQRVKPLKNQDKILKFNQKLLAASPGKRLILIQPFLKNKDLGLKFVRQQQRFWQQFLINPDQNDKLKISTKKARKIIKLLIRAYNDLERNINLKICLDNLVLAW